MEGKKILVAMPTGILYRDKLQAAWPESEFVFKEGPQVTPEDLKGVQIIIGNVAPGMLKACDSLEWVQLNSAGSDNYAKEGVLPENVMLTNATGSYGPALSEYVIAVSFAMIRNLDQYFAFQKEHRWVDAGPNGSMEGANVLVIGYGDIGQACGKRFKALGATVTGVRRHADPSPYADKVITNDDVDAALAEADIVVMVLPNSPETIGYMDARRLSLMKKGAYLVNVGRGPAVEPKALAEALTSGHLGGAAIDVTDPEPLPADDLLWDVPNLIITPHISGGFHMPVTGEKITDIAAENMRHYQNGEPMRSVVDRKTGYRRYEKG